MDFSRVVHTTVTQGKDQYGYPAINFRYEGNMNELAQELYDKIREDCDSHLDLDLYNAYLEDTTSPSVETEEVNSLSEPEPQKELSLYDLFGIPQEERTQISQKQKTKAGSQTLQNTSVGLVLNDLTDNTLTIRTQGQLPRLYEGILMDFYKDGVLVENEGQVGILSIKNKWNPKKQCEDQEYTFSPLKISRDITDRLKSYIALRESYFHLHQTETVDRYERPELRESLNNKYKEFTEKYGDLNSRENYQLLQQDIFGNEILTLEYYENGKKQLSAIFFHPVAFMTDKTLLVEKADEALASSINKFGDVNLDYMSAISGKGTDVLIDELDGIIYYNPLSQNYEISSRFIAGDVISKSEEIETYIKDHPDASDIGMSTKSLTVLKEAIPTPIPFSDISFNFGERWIPVSYYNEYVSELFNTKITIEYVADIDNFHIAAESQYTAEIREKYAVKPEYSNDVSGLTILSHALVNTFPKITKPSGRYNASGQEIRIPDLDAIQQANTKIDEIRSAFTDYLDNLPIETKGKLSELYNRKFNARVKPKYDGKFQTFPDLQLQPLGIESLYDSQYDTVWMLKSNDGGIVDHEVGAGKTLTICIAAHEMKRLKMAHKPMIIGLKTNIFAVAETYMKAYPNDKVLYPSEKDFEPKNRARLFHKIKNNDWDVIILTHEQFFKIPQSLEIQRDILQKELDSVEENLRVYERLNKISATAGMLKGLEKRQENLKVTLRELFQKMEDRRDDAVDFRTMGIDHLFIDESHYPNKNKIRIPTCN